MTKPTVCFSMHCHAGDVDNLYLNFNNIYKSHEYDFDEVIINHQRCEIPDNNIDATKRIIREEDYGPLLAKYGIDINDKRAIEITHDSAHYFTNHCVNHLNTLSKSDCTYIVFSDSDCVMINNNNWIDKAIEVLESDPNILIVCPSEGLPGKNQIMSQQLFICNRKRLSNIDFNCWDGKFIDGGPMASCYVMLEGRVGMYMLQENLYRLVLPNEVGYYYHDWEHIKEPKELHNLAMEKLK